MSYKNPSLFGLFISSVILNKKSTIMIIITTSIQLIDAEQKNSGRWLGVINVSIL